MSPTPRALRLLGALAALALSPTAFAQAGEIGQRGSSGIEGYARGFGVGVALGDPSGVALSVRPGDWSLLQGTVGWSLSRGRLHLSGDYVRNLFLFESEATPELRYPLYVGLGGRILLASEDGSSGNGERSARADQQSNVGVRVPVGTGLLPDTQALDVFLEVAPVIRLLPDFGVGWDAAVGLRIYPGGIGRPNER